MRKNLILGTGGQDGRIAALKLASVGEVVFANFRTQAQADHFRNAHPNVNIEQYILDLTDFEMLENLLTQIKPDVIFNFAALAQNKDLFENPKYVSRVNGILPMDILEVIKNFNLDSKFLQVSSSHVFGGMHQGSRANERSTRSPVSYYGAAKNYADQIAVIAREKYGIWSSIAIPFNHESPFRPLSSLTRYISHNIAEIVLGLKDSFGIRQINIMRDWSFAPDIVDGIILQSYLDEPCDLIFSSNNLTSLETYLELSFRNFNLSWRDHVDLYEEPLKDIYSYYGSNELAHKKLGWKPMAGVEDITRMMVDYDIRELTGTKEEYKWVF